MSTITWQEPQVRIAVGRPARPEVGGLRLTSRGRALVRAGSVLVALTAFFSAQSAAADAPGSATPVVTYTVAPGETLWQIAGTVAAPGQDLRDVVAELVSLNELPGAGLQAGQQILLPAG